MLRKSVFLEKNISVGKSPIIRIIRLKLKIWLHYFVRNSMQVPHLSLFNNNKIKHENPNFFKNYFEIKNILENKKLFFSILHMLC